MSKKRTTYIIPIVFIFLINGFSSSLFCQHINILISNSPSIEEPSIMINPFKTDEMVAGANLNYSFYSYDGGVKWTEQKLQSTYGVWGDPVLIIDNNQDYYYFHLSNPDSGNWIDRIVCQKSTDQGRNWSNGTFTGLNGTKVQDKEWAVVDRTTNNIYMTWTQFDVYGGITTPKPGDSTHIMFSMTSDGGQNWSQAIRIDETGGYCFDDDDAVEGAVPAVGPNGEVYVCWTGPLGLMFDRSVDSGKKWLEHDIKVSDVPGGWNYVIPGIYRANGLPVIACDTSGGNNHGTIYINWSDQRNGLDNTDIWLVKSTDGGNTWTQPTLVNNDNAVKQQFFTWMTIDQTSGFLYFVFYDRRNHDDEYTDVYLALSKNAGETFENHLISDSPFRPFPTVFFGDYTNISAHDGVVRPIWTRLDDTKLSVYTAIIDTSFTALPEIKNQDFVVENPSPNPFNSSSYLSFKLKKSSYVKLNVIDIFGRQVELMIDEQLPPGKYINHLDAEKYELKEGIYFYQLLVDKKLTSRKILFTN